jgi:hypothetical protein
MQEYKRMPEYKLKGGELVKVVKNDPRVIMEQAADLEDNAGLLGDIAYLAEVDDSTRRTGRGTSLNGKWRRKLQDKE